MNEEPHWLILILHSHEDLIVPITNGVCLILQKNELYPHREDIKHRNFPDQ